MNGPLIFTIIHLIKALECVEEEKMMPKMTDTKPTNETISLERQIPGQNFTEEEIPTYTDFPDSANPDELSGLVTLLKKHCSCPCSGVPHLPVCGRTTNGQFMTFDSQCHLICHNQCGQAERYAIVFHGECPPVPAIPPPNLNRKNVFSASHENRRVDGAAPAAAYASFITPLDWECDCSYCQSTRFIRLDYYPICAERSGQKITFESWCHFDCENKCVRHTGYSYLYLSKGTCKREQENEFGASLVGTVSPVTSEPCNTCNARCKEFFEPVCARNYKNEYLFFKSRCHMRCHNLCQGDPKNNFVHFFDGQCPWV